MSGPRKTAIVTGASQGIGAGIVKGFVERGFNVVSNSRKVTQSAEIAAGDHVALVDGHIGEPATAAKIVETAMSRFKSIDALVNNAGIFFLKPFTDYTAEDFKSLVSTNLEGFLYVTQLAVKHMLARKTGGSIVTITAALAANPIAGVKASVPMITKGGLDTITKHLAIEYAKDGIRFNAVAPGVVDTPLHKNDRKEVLQSLNPMGIVSSVKDIVDAVLYLTEASTVTGEILNVDGGAHTGPLVIERRFIVTTDSTTAEDRLARLGIHLPDAPTPFGAYAPAVQTGNLLFLSGMLATAGHAATITGVVGNNLDIKTGREAAHAAALNALALIRKQLGSLNRVRRVVRLGVYVAATPEFTDHAKVADAASELLRDVLGEQTVSSRLVIGVASLPLGSPVELEVILEMKP